MLELYSSPQKTVFSAPLHADQAICSAAPDASCAVVGGTFYCQGAVGIGPGEGGADIGVVGVVASARVAGGVVEARAIEGAACDDVALGCGVLRTRHPCHGLHLGVFLQRDTPLIKKST